ncbi:MAG TPA: pyridoxal-phosphate dependent enzyme, partial [Pyrinomonadaceae bacterium]|nr:pyridoxal-phosphate dependent enzyme [Pyrinomonadaceae bacterium]
ALGKGFSELKELGFIDRLPRLSVVQAAGAAPFAGLFNSEDTTETPDWTNWPALVPMEHPHTLATAIKIGAPVSWQKALRAVLTSEGTVLSVTEQEIADAKAIVGLDGVGCEPASASTVAGIKRLVADGTIGPDDDVVAVLTGHVLKDTEYVIRYHQDNLFSDTETSKRSKIKGAYRNPPALVEPTPEAIMKKLRSKGVSTKGGRG